MAMDYVSKIQALLAKAEHPNTPRPEAEAAAAMAAKLMKEKGIEEAQIRDSQGRDPEEITLMIMDLPTEHGTVMVEAIYPMVRAMGAESLYNPSVSEYTVVGTQSLLDSIKILITTVQLQMVGAANAAGDKHEAKLRKAHADWTEDQILDATDQWVWDYIRGYGKGLSDKISERVGELKDEAPGNALVLQSEADRTRRWFEQKFPNTQKLTPMRLQNWDATKKGIADGRNTDIGDGRVDGGKATRAIG
ncbi:DUF2786 domain-containing protein [Actinomadura litoris]|uniref:DUF2786 domain-containing protein n=1 Tax=Actinomadura litoris TaxID=2678616 RepID=UPI001FA7720A|nr:DUF2786 domain-containing protein [Actinomadura litoris]